MLVLSAPSGTGKTTLAKNIIEEDEHISLSISCTTRSKRPNEIDGKYYFFKTREQFQKQIDNDEFLEYAEIFGEFYGTLKKQVLDKLKKGEDVLFDIDWQGHRQLSAIARSDVASVFLLPPSKEALLQRLKARNQDNSEIIQYRMERADEEISHWHEYDYIIINRDIKQSTEKLLSVLRAERLRKERRTGLNDFVASLIHEKFVKSKVV
ncbi:Guanylate kinase [Candidatus Bandiella woodruffii]|uniref:Guanylate kinase n=2 Tax=Candidatus Bandiella euplotis TaxID=1664265 RepID=A0ABZ0UKU4_9RICK|nr:Guanylate kinase [Candidatus Bandiella woodruffii]